MESQGLLKQLEYYLGDANLSRDDFFREKISANKDGYVELSVFLNCNNVKKLGVKETSVLADTLVKSTALELNEGKTAVRRKGNMALPQRTGSLRKREAKAAGKETEKKEVADAKNGKDEKAEESAPVIRDEQGRIIFVAQDFENTLIVNFVTKDQDEAKDADYKVNWKDFENFIKNTFDRLKVVYSRADKYEGQLAISSYKYDKEQFEKLTSLVDQEINGKKFAFKELKDDELSEFWQKQGTHFHYCTAPKQRIAKKLSKKTEEKKREERAARQKQSYTIAGQLYMDINKVKSKSRAILNNIKDGEKLSDADSAFMRELLKFHDKAEDKQKDLSHIEVGAHPEFTKTRCFFVVKSDGSKEDFSVSKCTHNLELKSMGLDE